MNDKKIVLYTHIYIYMGWGKSMFTDVHVEDDTIINK